MSNIAKTTIGLMFLTLISKVLGFFRELCLGSVYGASAFTDAYIISQNIPIVIFTSVAMALGTSYIPLFCDIREKSGDKEAIKFSNNLINIVVIFCSLLAIVCMIFTEPIVKIFAMGFEGETLKLAVEFTRILIIGIIFIGVNDVLMPFLQINQNYAVPGMLGIPYNIVIIISIFASPKFGYNVLIYGTLLAILSKVLFQIPFAKKKGYKYKAYVNVKDKNIKKLLLLVAPVFVGVAVNQVNGLVDKTLASTLVEGSISALNYANKLNEFVMGIFIVSITSVIYPLLSKLSAANNKEEFNNSIVKSINYVILLVIPISIGAMVLSTPIVKLLFERGAFDLRATQMTSSALFCYSIGIIGFGLRDILSRVFYSIQDTKTPMINGAIAMALNIVLNLILIKYIGHAGLALATSISALVCIVLLFRSLRKKIGNFGEEKIAVVFIKTLISGVVMGIVTTIFYDFISNIVRGGMISQIVSLSTSVLVGVTVYFIGVVILKIDEVNEAISIIKDKFTTKRGGYSAK